MSLTILKAPGLLQGLFLLMLMQSAVRGPVVALKPGSQIINVEAYQFI